MQSERIELDDWQDSFEIIKEVAEQFEEKAKITGKDALRFSLLAEESIRLVSSIMTEKDPIEPPRHHRQQCVDWWQRHYPAWCHHR